MTIHFTGCHHFGHKAIIRMCDRPFQSLEEMEEVMIERHNAVVKKNDTVYHLGDFSFKNKVDREVYLKKLNGKFIKVRGNHDPKKGWGEDYIKFRQNGLIVVLMHYPLERWDGYHRRSIHLHCHTHDKEFISAERRGNVGVDATDFRPISLEEAVSRLLPEK